MLLSLATPSIGSNAEPLEPPHSLPSPDDTDTFYDSGFTPLHLLLGNLELGVKIAH
jgi:hypothetical protein